MTETKVERGDGGAPPAKASRSTLEQVAGSAAVIFLVAIVLMVNYLAFRHYERFDWTSQGMFTLSPKSKEVLHGLDQDVDLYLFMSRGESSFGTTDELLKRYQAASTRITVHYVDPDRQPSEFKLLAQRFGIAAGVIETGEARADVAAVVTAGDKRWHVSRDDLVAMSFGHFGGDGDEEVNVKAEQALTGAIVQVISGRPTKVCVTQGHGEWSVEERGERSLGMLKELLRHDNLEWEALETLGKKEVSEGCDAIMVLGPLRAFSADEAELLFSYLRGGGNLLLALDPVIERDQIAPTGFEEPLAELGVRLDRSLVLELDQRRLVSPSVADFLVTEFGDHETTRILNGRGRMLTSMARSVSLTGKSPEVEILLRTSDQGFGKTSIADLKQGESPERGPADVEGPVSLAVALQVGKSADDEAKKTGGRLIVVGDSDFLDPQMLASPELANGYLASAWTGHLTERPALIAIAPKKIKTGNVIFTQEDLSALLFRVGALIPGAAFLLGFAVWFNRRS